MKKFAAVILVLCMSVLLFACGKQTEPADNSVISAEATASKLAENLDFGDELEPTDSEITLSKYGLTSDNITECARYAGSGATADEVAVFICTGEEGIAEVKAAIDSRIEYLRDGYSSYGPEEVPKIDSAYVSVNESCVIFCISNSSSETIDALLK